MKRTLFVISMLLPFTAVMAQPAQAWLWPVKGIAAGEGIVSRPQERIEKELNFNHLFIAAPEGTEVVAPTDGTVGALMLTGVTSLQRQTTYGNDGGTFDRSRQRLEQEKLLVTPLKYINGSVMLRLADGRQLWIAGLRGDVALKTGQRIRRGQLLGTVAYAYRQIGRPHIGISISGKDRRPADPMTPFGLKSTFKKPKPVVTPKTLTAKQANEDFDFLMSAMRECYPSFSDIITDEQQARFVADCREQLRAPVSYEKFFQVVHRAFSNEFLHDSHAWIDTQNPLATGNWHVPHLFIGALDGRLFVTQAQPGYEKYLGREVVAVDGVEASVLMERQQRSMLHVEGNIESRRKRGLLTGWNGYFDNDLRAKTVTLRLADGTTVRDQWVPVSKVKGVEPAHSKSDYNRRAAVNRRSQWSFRLLSDSVALLTLGDFQLDQVQLEGIADSIARHRDVANMVIDVRQNPGGDVEVCRRLLSWFIDRPTEALAGYERVNSNTTYQSFAHCQNYGPDDRPFADYVPREGREGFYNPSTAEDVVRPDSALHYGGRLLVLIDETSLSAATDFPARLVRCGRATAVGRETGTGYHYMTAVKFAHLVLPHSHIEFTLPLVKAVLDETVTSRFPAGRGLLPDVEVPLTYEEFYTSADDLILRRALEVIGGR